MLFSLLVVFLSVIWMRIDEVLTAVVMHYTLLVNESQIGKSIEMPISCSLFVILDTSSDLSVSVCVEAVKVMLKVEVPFF